MVIKTHTDSPACTFVYLYVCVFSVCTAYSFQFYKYNYVIFLVKGCMTEDQVGRL